MLAVAIALCGIAVPVSAQITTGTISGSVKDVRCRLPARCFQSVLDLAIARNIRLGGGRQLQLRVDMFNAPNAAIITNRNTTMNLQNPNDPTTIVNLPFAANGTLIDARSRPRGAGFGVATDYQAARSVQFQARFSF